MDEPDFENKPYQRPDWYLDPEPKPEVKKDPRAQKYEFDIKVYGGVGRFEIPVPLPDKYGSVNTVLTNGYDTIEMEWTPEQRNTFVDWCWKNGRIKIIGER